jgi:WD40 repeat protein
MFRYLRPINPFVRLLALGLLLFAAGSYLAANQAVVPDQAKSAEAKQNPVDEKTIRDLIQQLGDESFEKRDQANQRLAEIGEPAIELLKNAAKDNPDAEIRNRAKILVETVNSRTFYQVRAFLNKNGGMVTRVIATPDGKHVVTAGFGPARLWEIATGKEAVMMPDMKTNNCWALGVSADGHRAISGCTGKSAHVFDFQTGTKIKQLVGHQGPIWGAALLGDGSKALTGAWDKTLRVWDVESGKEIRRFQNVTDDVRCLSLSPDGKSVAVGHFEKADGAGIIRLWDLEKGTEIRSFEGHALEVSNVAFSPDGKTLLSSGYDRTVRLWDVATGKEVKRFEGHIGPVENAAFTPDGKRVVSTGNELNSSVRLWDVATGKQIAQTQPVGDGFTGLTTLPGNRQCVSAGKDGTIRVWQWTK